MAKEPIKFFIGNIGKRLGKVHKFFSLVNPQSTKYWENRVEKNPEEIKKLPEQKIDKKMTDEEYIAWCNTLCKEAIKKKPSLFYSLRDSQKTREVYTEYAKLLEDNFKYKEFLESILDVSCKEGLSQEDYNTWVEDVIINIMLPKSNFKFLEIPEEKRTERVWNAILDRIIKEDYSYKKIYGLSFVPIQNITIEMCKRALKDIGPDQFSYIPSVDRRIDTISNDIKREEYEKWLSSLSEEEKQAYREWYESTVINCIKNHDFPGPIFTDSFEEFVKDGFTKIPTEAITINMINAYLEKNGVYALRDIPLPSNLTNYNEQQYEEIVLSAIKKEKNDNDIYWILDRILEKFVTDKLILEAIKRAPKYLDYADSEKENFDELLQIAYKKELESIGRTELSEQEIYLMKKFAKNNASLFSKLALSSLKPEIIKCISESSLEIIVRYSDVQYNIIKLSKDIDALTVFGFALENLREDSKFISPLIKRLSESIGEEIVDPRNRAIRKAGNFYKLASNRIKDTTRELSEEEKTIISYLSFNPQEAFKIEDYDDLLHYVENKNSELDEVISNPKSTLIDIKDAYLQRTVGIDYETALDLVNKYGNDPEELLAKYQEKNIESYKEKAEKEALEIVVKLKSLLNATDLMKVKKEYYKAISKEEKSCAFARLKNIYLLDNCLRRAYGKDIAYSLKDTSKENNIEYIEHTEDGQEYIVRKLTGPFNRMVSLMGAFRKSDAEGDMYDRWNTNKMSENHALCYSFIDETNPGTALLNFKNGIIVAIKDFDEEAVCAMAPYDLCSNFKNIGTYTERQQKFYMAKNLPNQTRGRYSEVDIEIQAVSKGTAEYKKIQPTSIICFEEVDEASIKAAIELSNKLGRTIPIELIDRRELANKTRKEIDNLLNEFKNGEILQPELIGQIITKFNNARNAYRDCNLGNELVGEEYTKNDIDIVNEKAIFCKTHLNQLLLESIDIVKKRMEKGEIQEGLATIAQIKQFIQEEREKNIRMPTMHLKQVMAGIDENIDYRLDEIQRMYNKRKMETYTRNITLEILQNSQEIDSPTFEGIYGESSIPQQLSFAELQDSIDITEIQTSVKEIHEHGYYKGNKLYSEENIARVAIFSSAIANVEGTDDITKRLLKEAVKYYSCGRRLDMPEEKHQEYSAKIAGQELKERLSETDLGIVQAAIELQNSVEDYPIVNKREREKEKVAKLCRKYRIDISNANRIECIARYIEDSINLSNDVFVNGTKSLPQKEFSLDHLGREKVYFIERLKTEAARKLIKASYCIQDELSREHLKEMAKVVTIDLPKGKSPILKEAELKHRFQEIDFEGLIEVFAKQEQTELKEDLPIASSCIESAKKIAELRTERDVVQTSQQVKTGYIERENLNQNEETAKE